jgi:hypothetical protein
MRKAIELLSIGKVADLLARALRWSPVGRTLTLHGAEGPSAKRFTGLTGKVDSVDDRGVIVISRAGCETEADAGACSLRLTPRHKGWTAFSMMLVRIAVVAELVGTDNRAHPVTIAIASISSRRV